MLNEVRMAVKALPLSGLRTRQTETEMMTTIKYRAIYRICGATSSCLTTLPFTLISLTEAGCRTIRNWYFISLHNSSALSDFTPPEVEPAIPHHIPTNTSIADGSTGQTLLSAMLKPVVEAKLKMWNEPESSASPQLFSIP